APGENKPQRVPRTTSLALTYEVKASDERVGNQSSGVPDVESTIENPFAKRYEATAPAVSAVLVSAKLQDSEGAGLGFKPITFSAKTYFGTITLGVRPTGADGVAHLKIIDKRLGAYYVNAGFAGDEQLLASSGSVQVVASPRPKPSLPEEGMLIDPYPTFWITIPFVLFFGTMWGVFAYILLLVRKLRALGIMVAKEF